MDVEKDFSEIVEMMETDPDFVEQYLEENDLVFSVPQCAKILNICSNTVLYRIKSESLKAERDSSGHWRVRAKDLKSHINSKARTTQETTQLPAKSQEEKGKIMKVSSYRYDKSTSQNVLDFLYTWEKANTIGFSTKTLTNDFNKVCATKTTEGQMGGILANLTKKSILVRKGRGIYCLVEGFVRPENTTSVAPKETIHSVPVVSVEDDQEEKTNPHWEEMKSEERHLVDKYLAKHSNPYEDFSFTISDLAREYPNIDRKKLGKAVQNMYHNNGLEKGKMIGEYVKVATKRRPSAPQQPAAPAAQDSRPSLGKNLEDVLKLNISDELKAKIIKEIIS